MCRLDPCRRHHHCQHGNHNRSSAHHLQPAYEQRRLGVARSCLISALARQPTRPTSRRDRIGHAALSAPARHLHHRLVQRRGIGILSGERPGATISIPASIISIASSRDDRRSSSSQASNKAANERVRAEHAQATRGPPGAHSRHVLRPDGRLLLHRLGRSAHPRLVLGEWRAQGHSAGTRGSRQLSGRVRREHCACFVLSGKLQFITTH